MPVNFETIPDEKLEDIRKHQRIRGEAEAVVKQYAAAGFKPVHAAFPISAVTTGTQATAKSILKAAVKKLKLEDKVNVVMLKDETKICLSTVANNSEPQ